jgi:signal transduction histidine kinase/CheY-like chemotaxis protein
MRTSVGTLATKGPIFENVPTVLRKPSPTIRIVRVSFVVASCLTGMPVFAADEGAGLPDRERLAMWAFVLIAGAAGIAIGWFAGHHGTRRLRTAGFKVPMLRFNSRGQVTSWNAAADELAKSSGLPNPQALAPEDAAAVVTACLSGKGEPTHEWSAGNSWFSATLEPLGGGVQMLLTDITVRHQLSDEIARMREETVANARLTSDYVSNISHDIRVPMSGVIGLGRLLLETDLNPEQQELSRTLIESAENAVTLADELLDLAKIEAGKLEIEVRPMELASLVEDTLRSQSARAAEKHIDLFCDIDSSLPGMINADPVRVRQVLANLVSNGLKFTQRGEIVVSVSSSSNADGTFDLKFAVRDTGIGIPEEKRDRLFKAFNQADSSTYKMHGGTGLGLVTSRQLAELMGGKLWFESEPNRGSTFFFTLPLHAVMNAVPPAWTLDQPQLQGQTVLVVEDNPRLLNLLGTLMTRWSMNVLAFRTTSEASAWLDRPSGQKSAVRVALVDLDLPELAAFPLLHRLAGIPGEPIRMMGMAFEPQARSRSTVSIELLLKPVCPSTLLDHLRRPVRDAVVAGKKEAVPAASSSEKKAPVVLVADDDPVNRRVVRNYLERLGCVVTTVSDGSEAFKRYEDGRFDIVFLDLMMPGMDGFAVTRAIRNNEATISHNPDQRRQPIIALTAKAMAGDSAASLAAGFDEHLTKPVSEQNFRDVLEKFAGYSHERPAPARMPRLAALQAPAIDDGIVDRARLSELGSGDPAAIADIARMYFERVAKLAPEITSALVSARTEDARRHAHTGAGSSSTAGMVKASKAFRTLEDAIGRGELASADKLLVDALEAVEECRKAMQPLLRTVPPPPMEKTH